jgi:hypothetical protein
MKIIIPEKFLFILLINHRRHYTTYFLECTQTATVKGVT